MRVVDWLAMAAERGLSPGVRDIFSFQKKKDAAL